MQLTRDVAPCFCERIDLAPADLARERRHGAQGLAQRGAIIVGDPVAEAEQFRIEHGLLVEQAQDVARGALGQVFCGAAVGPQHQPGQRARAERSQHPAPGLHPVAQGLRHPVGEGLVERHG